MCLAYHRGCCEWKWTLSLVLLVFEGVDSADTSICMWTILRDALSESQQSHWISHYWNMPNPPIRANMSKFVEEIWTLVDEYLTGTSMIMIY